MSPGSRPSETTCAIATISRRSWFASTSPSRLTPSAYLRGLEELAELDLDFSADVRVRGVPA